MARQTYRNVVDNVRALLIDPDGTLFKDDAILGFINLAERKTFCRLAMSDYELTNTFVDLNFNSANITALDWTTTPALPDDLIVPQKMWEGDLGATDENLQVMNYDERLDWRSQDIRLLEWTWQGGQLRMIGSTTTRRVRIEYARYPAKVSNLASSLTLPASADALTFGVAYYAAMSRGSLEQAAAVKQDWIDAILDLVNVSVKAHQEVGSRRKSYSANPTIGGTRFV